MSQLSPDLRQLEALLFASSEPMSIEAIRTQMPDGADVEALLTELGTLYDGRGVELVVVARKWTFRTAPDLADLLTVEKTVKRRLSRAAVETLSVVAYHQPVTRAEIEEIRGRSLSPGTLEILLENGWIQPKGRRRTPGRPTTWGTTEEFLRHFQLASLEDLPGIEELKAAGLLDTRAATLVTKGNLAPAQETLLSDDSDGEGDGEGESLMGEPLSAGDNGDGPAAWPTAEEEDEEPGAAADGADDPEDEAAHRVSRFGDDREEDPDDASERGHGLAARAPH